MFQADLSHWRGCCRFWSPRLFMAVLALAIPQTGIAQSACEPQWLPGGSVPGADGTVHALFQWDPDGDGPSAPLMIAGGEFVAIGGTKASRIAAYDGTQWHPLGSGCNGAVRSLGTFEGDLVVGGEFTTAGGVAANRIARWDGSSWSTFGNGIASGSVNTMVEFEGKLVVGGQFTVIASPWFSHLARFNGSTWQAMGDIGGIVNALLVHDGALYAGGKFDCRFAKWSGSEWQTDACFNQEILSLVLFEGDIIAAGFMTEVDGDPVYKTARFDGAQWHPMGAIASEIVSELTVFAGNLYAASIPLGGHAPKAVYRWTKSDWSKVGHDLFGYGSINALAGFEDELIVAGGFWKSQERHLLRIARLDAAENRWMPLIGTQFISMSGFLEFDDRLVAVGRFMDDDGTLRYRLAEWDSESEVWHPFGDAIDANIQGLTTMFTSDRFEVILFKGEIVVAGRFTSISGQPFNRIARWNEVSKQWLPLGSGMGYYRVNALAVYGDDLIAAGQFSEAGGAPAKHIARWDGQQWHPLGSGLEGFESRVHALSIYDGRLVVGGSFTKAGGVTVGSIAQWDGATWSGIGSGMNGSGTVNALKVYRNNLVVAGHFSGAGGISAPHLTRWDGADWHNLGASPGINAGISIAVQIWRNELLLGGGFFNNGAFPFKSIARWEGADWNDLDGGLNSSSTVTGNTNAEIHHMTVFQDVLFVGGTFSLAGEEISAYAARAVRLTPPADLNCDGSVNASDLNLLLSQWGACAPLPAPCSLDLNGDDVINVNDLLILINTWG